MHQADGRGIVVGKDRRRTNIHLSDLPRRPLPGIDAQFATKALFIWYRTSTIG